MNLDLPPYLKAEKKISPLKIPLFHGAIPPPSHPVVLYPPPLKLFYFVMCMERGGGSPPRGVGSGALLFSASMERGGGCPPRGVGSGAPAARSMKVREAALLFSAIDLSLEALAPFGSDGVGGCAAGVEGSVHVAAVVRRGKLLSCGTNRAGTRASGAGFSGQSLHAERAAVKALGDLSLLRGAELYVGRLPAAGHVRDGAASDLLFSRPCHECTIFLEKCMRVWGLRRVLYTTDMVVASLRPPSVLAGALDQRPPPPEELRARAQWEKRVRAERRCGALRGSAAADTVRLKAKKELLRVEARAA